MNILGISAFYHDSAACLVQDGEIISAAQEERFTRKKHDPSFPKQAIHYCLQDSGLKGEDLDFVAFVKEQLVIDKILSHKGLLQAHFHSPPQQALSAKELTYVSCYD